MSPRISKCQETGCEFEGTKSKRRHHKETVHHTSVVMIIGGVEVTTERKDGFFSCPCGAQVTSSRAFQRHSQCFEDRMYFIPVLLNVFIFLREPPSSEISEAPTGASGTPNPTTEASSANGAPNASETSTTNETSTASETLEHHQVQQQSTGESQHNSDSNLRQAEGYTKFIISRSAYIFRASSTPSAGQGRPDELGAAVLRCGLVYHFDSGLFQCASCRAVPPVEKLKGHLRHSHGIKMSAAEELIILSKARSSVSPYHTVQDRQLPDLAFLPVHCGFRCMECTRYLRSERTIKEHCLKEHKAKSYAPCFVQTLPGSTQCRYFWVTEPRPADAVLSARSIAALAESLISYRHVQPVVEVGNEVSLFYSQTGWHQLPLPAPASELRSYIVHSEWSALTAEEFAGVRAVGVDAILAVNSVDISARGAILGKKGRYFKSLLEETAQYYAAGWATLYLFLEELVASPLEQVEVPEVIKDLLDSSRAALRSFVQEETDQSRMAARKAIFEVFRALYSQKPTNSRAVNTLIAAFLFAHCRKDDPELCRAVEIEQICSKVLTLD